MISKLIDCHQYLILPGLLFEIASFSISLRLIAREMARIHAIHAHNGCIPKPNLWIKMQKYFSLVATEFTDQASNMRWVSVGHFSANFLLIRVTAAQKRDDKLEKGESEREKM